MDINPLLYLDSYKLGHKDQYPEGTQIVYSNFTPRSSRVEGQDKVVFFGLQYFIKKYLIEEFNKNFFGRPKHEVVARYKRRVDNYIGKDVVGTEHIEYLHDLGFLPIIIRALPEGTLCPLRVPMLTIENTDYNCFWLTNTLETLMSNILWMPCTSATTAFRYLKEFTKYADETVGNRDLVQWQGHDFSFRGLAGIESAMLSGAGHLLSFTGSDTIPAVDFLEEYYNTDCEKEIVGCSVNATEHSTQCLSTFVYQDGEFEQFKRLLTQVYPNGLVSIVCDSFDYWKVITEYLPKLKDVILNRNGKLVCRPDSGDPVKIICGDKDAPVGSPQYKGTIECMWEIFGGTITEKGYKLLDSHIGLIYGDSITPERQIAILNGLKEKGFASYNVVLGVGSFTYQYVTRDTYGFAMKATWGQVNGKGVSIFKDPKTDNGIKKSAAGRLAVLPYHNGDLYLKEDVDELDEMCSLLKPVFDEGVLVRDESLSVIRDRIKGQL